MIKTHRLPRLPHITIWLLFILISCSEKEKKAADPVDVQVLNIQNIDNRPSLKLEGEIVAYSRHELSFLVAGRIIKLNVKEGDPVEKGQEIAILDDSDYLEALKIAKSKLDEANDQYQRLSNMYAAGSLPEADFKKIKLLKKEAEANYKLYQNKHSYTRLVSQVSGNVSKVWSREGSAIDQGQPVVSVVNSTSVYASVGVPEMSINQVNMKDSCIVVVPATKDTLSGVIFKVSPVASRITRTYELDVIIDNAQGKLKDGMLCSVTVHQFATESMLQVPLSLIIQDVNNLSYVFMAREGIAKKQRIVTGKVVGNNVEVEKGLVIGDKIIINPPINITDGLKINY